MLKVKIIKIQVGMRQILTCKLLILQQTSFYPYKGILQRVPVVNIKADL